jgi:hypothetical protein
LFTSHPTAAERWTVDRCGVDVSYRINYFRHKTDGDYFYAKVMPPLSMAGAADYARIAWRRLWEVMD